MRIQNNRTYNIPFEDVNLVPGINENVPDGIKKIVHFNEYVSCGVLTILDVVKEKADDSKTPKKGLKKDTK